VDNTHLRQPTLKSQISQLQQELGPTSYPDRQFDFTTKSEGHTVHPSVIYPGLTNYLSKAYNIDQAVETVKRHTPTAYVVQLSPEAAVTARQLTHGTTYHGQSWTLAPRFHPPPESPATCNNSVIVAGVSQDLSTPFILDEIKLYNQWPANCNPEDFISLTRLSRVCPNTGHAVPSRSLQLYSLPDQHRSSYCDEVMFRSEVSLLSSSHSGLPENDLTRPPQTRHYVTIISDGS